jgi:hypothetical protein
VRVEGTGVALALLGKLKQFVRGDQGRRRL